MRVGLWRKLSAEELMLLNRGVGKDSWELLDTKEITPVNFKVNQPWIFIGRNDAEAPILWPPYVKSWLVGKDPDSGKDWRQEKRVTEDEMVGWHHRLNGHESSKLWEMVKDREDWHAAVHGVTKTQTWLSDWTTEQQQSMLSWIRAPKKYSWYLFQLWFLFPLWTDFL